MESAATKDELMQTLLQNPTVMMRNIVKGSLHKFIKYFWSEYSAEEFKDNWHISYICNELEKLARNRAAGKTREYDLLVNVPPGTTKTAMVSIFFPIWCWTNWYWMKFITASYSSTLSLESAEYSRDIVRSEKFKILFPELEVKEDKDTKGNFRIVKREQKYIGYEARTKQGGNRFSTSIGGTVTGFHAHILIWDDPLNPQQAISEVQLKTAVDWLDHTFSNRKVDKLKDVTIGIMQRLHQMDPTGHQLKKKKKLKHISLPGEIRNYREQVQPKTAIKYYKDDLLDPVRMPWSVLSDMLIDLGQYGFAGQIGQKPTPPGGGMFKVDRFQIIDKIPQETLIEKKVRYWDKAGSEGTGAFTVGVKMYKLKNDKWLIVDVKRGQWSSEVRESIIRATAEADGVDVQVGIEQEPGSGGKESAESTKKRLAGFMCVADRPTGDKITRADVFSVPVNDGNVMLMRGDWNHEFTEELQHFPFGTYKDQVDAGSGAYKLLTGKRRAKMIGGNRA